MQKVFDIFKGVSHVIINNFHNLKSLVTNSTEIDVDLKNKYTFILQDKINEINEYVKHVTYLYNNSKSDFVIINKNEHLVKYLAGQKHMFENAQTVIFDSIKAANKDVVITDSDDDQVPAKGIGRYYSKDVAQTIIDEGQLHFGNMVYTPELKLNNNGISGAHTTSLINHLSHARQSQTKSKDTVIDVNKIGRGLTTPMVAFENYDHRLHNLDLHTKHYYAKSKPYQATQIVIEDKPNNDGKVNTNDIVL